MKNSITSQSTGGNKKCEGVGHGLKIAHNYQAHISKWKPSKHAKGKQKGVK